MMPGNDASLVNKLSQLLMLASGWRREAGWKGRADRHRKTSAGRGAHPSAGAEFGVDVVYTTGCRMHW
jgi:hypothetical protein